jgi:hypothetical protein
LLAAVGGFPTPATPPRGSPSTSPGLRCADPVNAKESMRLHLQECPCVRRVVCGRVAAASCVRASADSVSPQSRTSALVLLSTMAAVLPDTVLAHLMPVFQLVGASSLAREDSYTFFIVQKVRCGAEGSIAHQGARQGGDVVGWGGGGVVCALLYVPRVFVLRHFDPADLGALVCGAGNGGGAGAATEAVADGGVGVCRAVLHRGAQIIESVVPPLRDHGYKIGLTLFDLLHVFVANVDTIPNHRRRQLFASLTTTLGCAPGRDSATDRSRFLFAQVACLLSHHARSGTRPQDASGGAGSVDADADADAAAGNDGFAGSYIPELCRCVL